MSPDGPDLDLGHPEGSPERPRGASGRRRRRVRYRTRLSVGDALSILARACALLAAGVATLAVLSIMWRHAPGLFGIEL